MLNQASQLSSSLPALLAKGQACEDFGLVEASSHSFLDQLNRVNANRDAAAVIPVSNVGLCRGPFQIFNTVVGANLIFVMDDRKIVRVGDKGHRHQSVDGYGFNLAIGRQFHFRVANGCDPQGHYSASDPSLCGSGLVSINKSTETANSTKAADLVSSKSRNISPLLSTFFHQYWRCLRENSGSGGFDVESFGSPVSRFTQVGHQVSIVDGCGQKSRRKSTLKIALAMLSKAAKTTNPQLVRKFVLAFVARYINPFLMAFHCLSPVLFMLPKERITDRQNPLVSQGKFSTSNIKEFL